MTLLQNHLSQIVDSRIFRYLIIGVIMNSMQESHLELEKEKKSSELHSENIEGLLQELDRKVDALKSDLSSLKDAIKY